MHFDNSSVYKGLRLEPYLCLSFHNRQYVNEAKARIPVGRFVHVDAI